MDSSDSAPSIARDAVRELLADFDGPSTPLTTGEIAARSDWSESTATAHLETLADLDELRSRELPDGTRVWWRPGSTESIDGNGRLEEFGAFVSAVKDYAIFMLEPDGTVASWNQGARRIKGYAADEIVGEHFSTFYTEEDVAADVPGSNLETAAEEGRTEDEGWRVRADGSRFWANVVITAIRGVDGSLKGFTKVTRDMTEQREYELQLRKERDVTEQILETVPVGISVVETDGSFVRANQQALDLLEIERSAVGEQSLDDRSVYDASGSEIPDEDRPWRTVVETGQPVSDFQCQIDLSSGERRWLSINAVPLEGDLGGTDDIVVSLEDVTDQKTRERKLEQRKVELETELGGILARISDAFFALDEDWRFTHVNEHAAGLIDREPDELTGRSFWEVFPEQDDGPLREKFDEAMRSQEPLDFDRHDEELDAWLEYNVYPSESGLSVYIQDITDRREYQRKLEESNERLEQFAHAASHDLQEPLRMVSSYLQLIERRYGDELDEEGREYLQFAVDGADRMREMIDSLLGYSRVQTQGQALEPIDLDDVLEEALASLGKRIDERDAEITAESLPRVRGDAGQLHQVFQNLLDNAIEYAGDARPRVHVSAERMGDRWVIAVEDEGIGIDPGESDRIFEVFERLHTAEEYEGTGIGLALCERLVERHGGEMWVDSEPGEGSTFSFTLPAVAE
jgi:PAS domain S-box-containing protein